ncbi:MAG: hypothetical protein P8N92_01550, partial [Burkholderiales bacterium]|nr:hypothetical protein [Burkholderiales bacterium]
MIPSLSFQTERPFTHKTASSASGSYIDATLAKALAKRFFDEANARFNRITAHQDFKDMLSSKSHISRKRWKIQRKKFERLIAREPSLFYEGGTKSKPAFVASVWEVAEINGRGFEESVLVCRNFTSQYTNKWAHKNIAGFAPVVITKHVLARIFQRIPEARRMTEQWSFDWVASIIAPILTWSGFWVERSYARFLKLKDVMNIDAEIKPIIPSEYGLFMCSFDAHCDQPLVVRTFVDTERLKDKQVVVRDIMIKSARDLDVLRLPLSPLNVYGVNYAFSSWILAARLAEYQDKFEEMLFTCSRSLLEVFKQWDF